MATIKVAEIFHSLQGEGLWVGVPSVFLRTFGCNFECRGFGLPNGQYSTEPEEYAEQYKVNPHWEYNDLPLAKTGCDSYASWHKGFKDLSPKLSVDSVVDEIETARLAAGGDPTNNGGTHLVITGGEPLLGWQRAYPELLDKVLEKGYKEVTFETNGTQKIVDTFADYMFLQQIKGAEHDQHINFTFSVSPKLYMSGEDECDALKPEIVADYQRFGTVYLKFVVADHSDMADVLEFVEAYREAGWDGEVYLMPCGGISDMYNENAPEVAQLAIQHGFRYSPRLQVDLWKNAWGT